jgi:hypothetical protein
MEIVMSPRRNVRITIAAGVVSLVALSAPSAQAADVCNQARAGHTGSYIATDGDPSTPARHQQGLAVLGSGDGLTHAALRSPALSECVLPSDGSGGVTVIPPAAT